MKNNISIFTFTVILLVMLITNSQAQTTRYVKPVATGAGTGATWADASADLQAMIDISAVNDIVWVVTGTYKPVAYPTGCTSGCATTRNYAFILKNEVKVYGGFAGTETALSQRNIATNPTILSGDIGTIGNNTDNVYHVVISVNDNNNTVLDGFTIRDANADSFSAVVIEGRSVASIYGGGMHIARSSPTITNCTFNSNTVETSGGYGGGYGGGLYNTSSSPIITNCVFSGNNASLGSGMYNNSSSFPIITNCVFSNN